MSQDDTNEVVSEVEGFSPASAPGKSAGERLKQRVQRHSLDRLLRKKLVLPGGVSVSAEKHEGRLVVRVESPD